MCALLVVGYVNKKLKYFGRLKKLKYLYCFATAHLIEIEVHPRYFLEPVVASGRYAVQSKVAFSIALLIVPVHTFEVVLSTESRPFVHFIVDAISFNCSLIRSYGV